MDAIAERNVLVKSFADKIGFNVKDVPTLRTALTHKSFTSENEGAPNNERLEFLGDAVLDLAVSDILFRAYPDMPEGEMAKARSAVVNEDTLAEIGAELELGSYMFFGKGEAKSGGSKKPSILADCLEAVIAAMYLDAGFEVACKFVQDHWNERAVLSAVNPGVADYKTRFQEVVVKLNGFKPKYLLEAQGPEHDRIFSAQVYVGDEMMGEGVGKSKKIAEQDAARCGLEYLQNKTAK